jgi:hypothetical protein
MAEPARTVIYFSTVRDFRKWLEEEGDQYSIESMCQFGALLLVVIKRLPLIKAEIEAEIKEEVKVEPRVEPLRRVALIK